jgi:hypothetical protein
MFMIGFNYDECNIINLMIIVGMFKMNYMINGLVIGQMCLETWYVVQYVANQNYLIINVNISNN